MTDTATMGVLWSSWSSTFSPFGKSYSTNLMFWANAVWSKKTQRKMGRKNLFMACFILKMKFAARSWGNQQRKQAGFDEVLSLFGKKHSSPAELAGLPPKK